MLVRANFILDGNYFIASPDSRSKPPSLHADHVQYPQEQAQVDLPQNAKFANENQYNIALKSSTDKNINTMCSNFPTFITTSSILQPQNINDISTKMPATSLLLESPISSCIGSIDLKENHNFLTDDETITSPANLIFYTRREDFYPPQKMVEQQQQAEDEISPPALSHNRRQSIHMSVTRICPKTASIHEVSGMPVFKPSGTYKKPRHVYRRLKAFVKRRK